MILTNHRRDLFSGFLQKLQTEVSSPSLDQTMGIVCPSLGNTVEEGVTTTGIGLQPVLRTHPITQVDLMAFAGSTAISKVFTAGEKGAEHTVLHMEQGHMLVQGDFKPLGRGHGQ
jgi:hypothetical protein